MMPAANRQLIPLLILAHICVDAVLLTCSRNESFRQTYQPFLFGVLLAQVPLVAIWFALGRSKVFWRAAGTLGVICTLSAIAARCVDHWDAWENTSVSELFAEDVGKGFFLAFLVVVPLFPMRWFGVYARHGLEINSLVQPSPMRQRWQFSIWELLLLMTAISLCLSLTLWVDFSWLKSPLAAICGAALAYGTLGYVLALLVPGNWRLNLLWLILALAAKNALFAPIMPKVYPLGMLYSPVIWGQVFAAIASALVVRVAGYQLYWTPDWGKRLAAETESCGAASRELD